MYGTEFQSGFFGPTAKYQDVPCAVCEVQAGSKTIMIPGRYNSSAILVGRENIMET